VRLLEVILEMNVRVQLNGLNLKLIGIQVLINLQRPLGLHIPIYSVVLANTMMKIIQIWRMMDKKIYLKVIE